MNINNTFWKLKNYQNSLKSKFLTNEAGRKRHGPVAFRALSLDSERGRASTGLGTNNLPPWSVAFYPKSYNHKKFIDKNFASKSNSLNFLFQVNKNNTNSNVSSSSLPFFNKSFDKKKLKNLFSWYYANKGETAAFSLIETLQKLGFQYAMKAGISLGVDDLKVPFTKGDSLTEAVESLNSTKASVNSGDVTALEEFQQFVDIWHRTSETLKTSVIQNFTRNNDSSFFTKTVETPLKPIINPFKLNFGFLPKKTKKDKEYVDLKKETMRPLVELYPQSGKSKINFSDRSYGNRLNPVYMMAFSGARGNLSQVRQLVGMRGLMADPQGQLVEFPIQSNFREGLTVTEYMISCYGARKGLVDTALRTAAAGYLTRRLVDVSHHQIVRFVTCGTKNGISIPLHLKQNSKVSSPVPNLPSTWSVPLQEKKHPNKNFFSNNKLSTKLTICIGRVLARDIPGLAFRNQEIDISLASSPTLQKIYETVGISVRSPLTCRAEKGVCQLCYGWSVSANRLVGLGEAVGIIAAQSIGEPGTQLTMRTFHTGGVFSGDVMEECRAKNDGTVEFKSPYLGLMVRTAGGSIAFCIKTPGIFHIKNNSQITIYNLLPNSLLFVRQGEKVKAGSLLAQIPNLPEIEENSGEATKTIFSNFSGEVRQTGTLNPELENITILSSQKEVSLYFRNSTTNSVIDQTKNSLEKCYYNSSEPLESILNSKTPLGKSGSKDLKRVKNLEGSFLQSSLRPIPDTSLRPFLSGPLPLSWSYPKEEDYRVKKQAFSGFSYTLGSKEPRSLTKSQHQTDQVSTKKLVNIIPGCHRFSEKPKKSQDLNQSSLNTNFQYPYTQIFKAYQNKRKIKKKTNKLQTRILKKLRFFICLKKNPIITQKNSNLFPSFGMSKTRENLAFTKISGLTEQLTKFLPDPKNSTLYSLKFNRNSPKVEKSEKALEFYVNEFSFLMLLNKKNILLPFVIEKSIKKNREKWVKLKKYNYLFWKLSILLFIKSYNLNIFLNFSKKIYLKKQALTWASLDPLLAAKGKKDLRVINLAKNMATKSQKNRNWLKRDLEERVGRSFQGLSRDLASDGSLGTFGPFAKGPYSGFWPITHSALLRIGFQEKSSKKKLTKKFDKNLNFFNFFQIFCNYQWYKNHPSIQNKSFKTALFSNSLRKKNEINNRYKFAYNLGLKAENTLEFSNLQIKIFEFSLMAKNHSIQEFDLTLGRNQNFQNFRSRLSYFPQISRSTLLTTPNLLKPFSVIEDKKFLFQQIFKNSNFVDPKNTLSSFKSTQKTSYQQYGEIFPIQESREIKDFSRIYSSCSKDRALAGGLFEVWPPNEASDPSVPLVPLLGKGKGKDKAVSLVPQRSKGNVNALKKNILTHYDRVSYKLLFKKVQSSYFSGPQIGSFINIGDNLSQNQSSAYCGQVIEKSFSNLTLRLTQNILYSNFRFRPARINKDITNGYWLGKGSPLVTLPYITNVTGDIVAGIPKIEQLFEARGEVLDETVEKIWSSYKSAFLTKAKAVRECYKEIGLFVVLSIQNVYLSQGVHIADKHLEVIIRQMTQRALIIDPGDTEFLADEFVDLHTIECINWSIYGVHASYKPHLIGITKASLTSNSFLSSASFQQTARVLERETFLEKTDRLLGLKERIMLGAVINAGTGGLQTNVFLSKTHKKSSSPRFGELNFFNKLDFFSRRNIKVL